nr:hypothetical protein [Tanacetum cinerariifolium]
NDTPLRLAPASSGERSRGKRRSRSSVRSEVMGFFSAEVAENLEQLLGVKGAVGPQSEGQHSAEVGPTGGWLAKSEKAMVGDVRRVVVSGGVFLMQGGELQGD